MQPRLAPLAPSDALLLFERTRARTDRLAAPLSPEDMMLQSMEDASPAKWHLAHTTWFFEEFILRPRLPTYVSPDDRFAFLFNSYYVQAGPRHARDKRGLVSRPGGEAVRAYRTHVEDALADLMSASRDDADEIAGLVELGCHHEMQHQELLVTDLLHGLSHNPLLPVYREPEPLPVTSEVPLTWTKHDEGLVEIGHDGGGFAYDCEGPRHRTYLTPYEIADRPVTNREWIAFMEDGGYGDARHWLMEGHAVALREGWAHPLYWWQQDDTWWTYTLRGPQPVALDAPVVHVSYYEAEAYARWADARLPTEAEHEIAFETDPIQGNFLDDGPLRPLPGRAIWGDVWEWTASPFTPYPGFRAPEGALGEYNGKFMVNQMVLRGGSCATPRDQMRTSYRTFFYPHQRWQMMGLRLARDL
ncbi:ergothioneine biosynthesis protein EgtB [Jannaschia pagri]|uniref:Ergothioneine biosynthesis protein EgtB n=1 Tax=Jannaschia pagri TaxID=2829797 RepID=A0ABQ4NJF0_9RHOB|nr:MULTISPECIES: ergothioneine biosynthesis protein EgtB [unclassified Jannaschia]GIT89573.1 ergothioneine biosynthesis protein EgtB [Jannaschia sp. AI_61]GIT94319.1 ergothioneine biosynthesis protein EgtB [Jannaschia sp. AI_62]